MIWLFDIITQNVREIKIVIIAFPYCGTEMAVANAIDSWYEIRFHEKMNDLQSTWNRQNISNLPPMRSWHSRQFDRAYVVMCALVGMMLLVAERPHSALMQLNFVSCRGSMNHDMGSQRNCAFPPETASMSSTVLYQQVIPFTIFHIRLSWYRLFSKAYGVGIALLMIICNCQMPLRRMEVRTSEIMTA